MYKASTPISPADTPGGLLVTIGYVYSAIRARGVYGLAGLKTAITIQTNLSHTSLGDVVTVGQGQLVDQTQYFL